MQQGDNLLVLERQRTLDRLSQSAIIADRAKAHWRNKEQDQAGLNLMKTALHKMKTEAEMRDTHRMARVKQLNVRGKTQLKYSADDLMRTNYQGHYNR